MSRLIAICLPLFFVASFAAPQAFAQIETTEKLADAPSAEQPAVIDELTATDEAIASQLRAVFDRVEKFNGIGVEVEEGVVYMTGQVDRDDSRDKAEAFAERLDGVVFVANEVEVTLDVDSRIVPAVDRIRTFFSNLIQYLPLIGLAIVLVVVFYGLARLLTYSQRPFELLGLHPLLADLLRRLIFFVVVAIGFFIAIDLLDIAALVGAAVGAAGVAGIALGFAFRDTAENYLAGVLMSLRRPFNISDYLKVAEHEGTVVRLTPRELVLMTIEGNHVRLPNSMVFKSVIYNFTANPRRQFKVEVGLHVDVDLVEAQRIGVQAVADVTGVLADPKPFSRIAELGDSTVIVRFFGWVDQRETGFFKARSEAIRVLKQTFDAADMEMPIPQYQVALTRPTKAKPFAAGDQQTRPPSAASGSEDTARDESEEAVVQEQIEQDLAHSGEKNLLKGDEPS